MRTTIEAPIKGIHPAKTPPTRLVEFVESAAEIAMLALLFGGALFIMPAVACWLCANF